VNLYNNLTISDVYVLSLVLILSFRFLIEKGGAFQFDRKWSYSDIALVVLYLVPMARIGGVDYFNYQIRFDNFNFEWSNPFYSCLVYVFSLYGLGYFHFNLAHSIFAIYVVRRLCLAVDLSFGLLLYCLLSHPFIVRDFAQSKVGLAMHVVIFGVTLQSWPFRYICVILGGLIHPSVICIFPVIAIIELMSSPNKLIRLNFQSGIAVLLLLFWFASLAIEASTNFIPSLEVYSRRETEWAPAVVRLVDIFYALGLLYLLYNINISGFKGMPDKSFKILLLSVMSCILSIFVLLVFGNHNILAYRLFNILSVFSPVLLIYHVKQQGCRLSDLSAYRWYVYFFIVILPVIGVYYTNAESVLDGLVFYSF